jgi:alpha-amylase/alpha-mannosidase (GH57 family)
MKIDWDPESKRMIANMSKEEAWALSEQLSKIDIMNKKGHSWIAKRYLRSFGAMIRKVDKQLKKAI